MVAILFVDVCSAVEGRGDEGRVVLEEGGDVGRALVPFILDGHRSTVVEQDFQTGRVGSFGGIM